MTSFKHTSIRFSFAPVSSTGQALSAAYNAVDRRVSEKLLSANG